ncbi:unnamed protein product [Nyctereutes procyonoides]|uniref:(raccoon dog) hypothetical protein n=1 Tax=Nyctereutes procyonoides TaxID=34880 RepID=A0A811YF18_NYCPR|nr:unnamed protein product [Nyctereutes procyonoides]
MSLCVWLLSLSKMFLKFIQVVTWIRPSEWAMEGSFWFQGGGKDPAHGFGTGWPRAHLSQMITLG